MQVTISGFPESPEKPKKKVLLFGFNNWKKVLNHVQELLSGVGMLTVTVERAEGLSKEWMDTAISALERSL